MKYLVTGGFGFIGSHLVEELVSNGHKVTAFDNLSNGQIRNLDGVKNEITSYISNVEQIRQTYFGESFDGIFHLATAPRSSSLDDPMRDIETNCKGMIAVLELAKNHLAKVVFTSNSGIYGSKDDGSAIDENSAINPTTPYDANKLVSEYYCSIYHKIHSVRSVVLRLVTVYGERQKVNENLNWRPLVTTLAKNMVNDEQVVIDGDGKQTRDLVYVKDVVRGIIKAMDSSIDNADIFLLSTNKETSVNQVLHAVEDIVGKKANPLYGPTLKGDIRRMRYSYTKAKSKLGFEPKFDLHDGIRKLVDYIQKNK